MEIYIKPYKKAKTNKPEIFLRDIAEVISPEAGAGNVKIADITKKTSLVSVVDIVRALKRRYPQATVINLGESDTLVDYEPRKPKDSKLFGYLKIIFVAAVLFAGSATAIMSFYTDAQMNKVFENMYYIITGQRTDNPMIIEIPFCFGIAAGIIVFFNHVGGKKLSSEPTPMEVEMASYDSDVTDTLINTLSEEREGQGTDDG